MAVLNKRVMGFVYGMGAAVVIVGALFKLQHYPGAGILLVVGLLTEAGIFALSAFEAPPEEVDWSLVYPQLAGGKATDSKGKTHETEESILSKKLDEMLKAAKIDGELMASLGNSIRNFETAAKNIAPTVDSIAATKKYNEELLQASNQMGALNSAYKAQIENVSVSLKANTEIVENAMKLKEQMKSMTSNISSLNAVYGGMLTAMGNK